MVNLGKGLARLRLALPSGGAIKQKEPLSRLFIIYVYRLQVNLSVVYVNYKRLLTQPLFV